MALARSTCGVSHLTSRRWTSITSFRASMCAARVAFRNTSPDQAEEYGASAATKSSAVLSATTLQYSACALSAAARTLPCESSGQGASGSMRRSEASANAWRRSSSACRRPALARKSAGKSARFRNRSAAVRKASGSATLFSTRLQYVSTSVSDCQRTGSLAYVALQRTSVTETGSARGSAHAGTRKAATIDRLPNARELKVVVNTD
mmetsp:Transcript_44309/g.71757  ORF Transcript_44309/g.71757 Transcript_44309/m.71757 type:complete len:207 (-) Transcript_44309:2-622(-)